MIVTRGIKRNINNNKNTQLIKDDCNKGNQGCVLMINIKRIYYHRNNKSNLSQLSKNIISEKMVGIALGFRFRLVVWCWNNQNQTIDTYTGFSKILFEENHWSNSDAIQVILDGLQYAT